MQMSKFSLYSDERQKSGLDAISDIYSILRDEAARTNRMDVSYAHALNWISRKVCSQETRVDACLQLSIFLESELDVKLQEQSPVSSCQNKLKHRIKREKYEPNEIVNTVSSCHLMKMKLKKVTKTNFFSLQLLRNCGRSRGSN